MRSIPIPSIAPTLTYDKLNTTSLAGVFGGRLAYPLSGGLGLRAEVGRALSLDLDYLLTSSINGIESQKIRGAVKYGF
ncbi:hypothetical protein ACWAUC_16615 [Bradyrhizobium guangdongense]